MRLLRKLTFPDKRIHLDSDLSCTLTPTKTSQSTIDSDCLRELRFYYNFLETSKMLEVFIEGYEICGDGDGFWSQYVVRSTLYA